MRKLSNIALMLILSVVACDKDKPTGSGPLPSGKAVAVQDVPGKSGTPTGTATHNSVSLTWEAAAGADSYQVKRRRPGVDPIGTLHQIGSPTGTSFVDNTVEPETEYGYRIWGVNSSGVGARSGILKITTSAAPVEEEDTSVISPNDQDVPGKPGTPTGAATHTTVYLTWEAAEGADSYQVKRRRPGVDPIGTLHLIGSPTNPAFIDNTIEPETEYGYSVWGVNSSGVGARSGLFKITTEAAPVENEKGTVTSEEQDGNSGIGVRSENKKGTVTSEEEDDNSGIGVRNDHGGDGDGNTRGSVVDLGDITDSVLEETDNSVEMDDAHNNRDIFVFTISEFNSHMSLVMKTLSSLEDADMTLWSGLDENDDYSETGATRIAANIKSSGADEALSVTLNPGKYYIVIEAVGEDNGNVYTFKYSRDLTHRSNCGPERTGTMEHSYYDNGVRTDDQLVFRSSDNAYVFRGSAVRDNNGNLVRNREQAYAILRRDGIEYKAIPWDDCGAWQCLPHKARTTGEVLFGDISFIWDCVPISAISPLLPE